MHKWKYLLQHNRRYRNITHDVVFLTGKGATDREIFKVTSVCFSMSTNGQTYRPIWVLML